MSYCCVPVCAGVCVTSLPTRCGDVCVCERERDGERLCCCLATVSASAGSGSDADAGEGGGDGGEVSELGEILEYLRQERLKRRSSHRAATTSSALDHGTFAPVWMSRMCALKSVSVCGCVAISLPYPRPVFRSHGAILRPVRYHHRLRPGIDIRNGVI